MNVCACGAKLIRQAEHRTTTCDDCAQKRLGDYQDLHERWTKLERDNKLLLHLVRKVSSENVALESEIAAVRESRDTAYNRGWMKGRRLVEREAGAA